MSDGTAAPSTVREIAGEINRRSEGHPIGRLQQLRRELRGRDRVLTHLIFGTRTIFDTYAFHVGGRSELQFNIGIESIEGREFLRHGVAFSLELGRNLPTIDPLVARADRFNEFLRTYADEFSDLRMRHFTEGDRSANYSPAPIPPELVRPGVFIFLGRLLPSAHPDVERMLDDFDHLLLLYQFVEGNDTFPDISPQFSPGCGVKPSATVASVTAQKLDVLLRHNDLQTALYNHLSMRHGQDSVRAEQGTGAGTRIDLVVRFGERYWFYEIKTFRSARACIRDALAQLLEYSYWPRAQEAERLIIIGEPPLDEEASAFLLSMRVRFGLPIYYQQFVMDEERLVE